MKDMLVLQKKEEASIAKEIIEQYKIHSWFIINKKKVDGLRNILETNEKERALETLQELKTKKSLDDILLQKELVNLSPPAEKNMTVVETHPITEPYSYIRILYDNKKHEYIYGVLEPYVGEKEIFNFLEETLMKTMDLDLEELTITGAKEYLEKETNRIIRDYSIALDVMSKKKIMYYLNRNFLGYGKIDALMKDSMIEDISCDGSSVPLYIFHRNYESIKTNVFFDSDSELDSFVIKLAQKCGRHISIAQPLMDATMPDGSRIQASLSKEVTTMGSTFTIRRFREEPFTPPDLVQYGTISPDMAAYFWLAIENGASAIISGGTASGKTTTLNALSLFIPPQSKIVSIEDTREINLPHPNWIAAVTREGTVESKEETDIGMFDLLKSALRQRPEYILLGEIRGREANVLFQAMATGHTTYSTMHADSIYSIVHRLEGEPISIPRIQLQALDIVAIQASMKIKQKRVRKIKNVIEVMGLDPHTQELLTNDVFAWNPRENDFEYFGRGHLFDRIAENRNLSDNELIEEFERRKKIITWMIDKGVRNYREVGEIISAYYKHPDIVMKRMGE